MNTSKILGMIVGAILVVFTIVFGSIIFAGLLDTANDISLTLFKTIYFAFILSVLGVVYLANMDALGTKIEHVLILVSILIFSAGLAAFAGNLKGISDINYASSSTSIETLQAQNQYYSQYLQSMLTFEDSVRSNNRLLEADVEKLMGKINNKTPVVVETIVTLPPEIIYVEENSSVNDTVYVEYDDKSEEDD
jgi:hypothetical protein